MSTRRLFIGTGRYEKIPKTFRLCDCCAEGKIESEENFILECQNYNEERSTLFQEISRENKQSKNMVTKRLFQNSDLSPLNELGKFLKAC